jgi:hypothetical protein
MDVALLREEWSWPHRTGCDDSYPLAHHVVHETRFGLLAGVGGDDSPDAVAELCRRIAIDLGEPFLQGGADARLCWREYTLGRGADGLFILAIIGLGLQAFSVLKDWDACVERLRRAAAAVRRAMDRHRLKPNVEVMKLLCVEEVCKSSPEARPDFHRLRSATSFGQFADGTWELGGPAYVVVPDPGSRCTWIFVVNDRGEILHRMKTPYLERTNDDEDRALFGRLTDGAPKDDEPGA